MLLDESNEVVEKFGVQGIPTKFIVDGKGRIRFQSVGFSGVESEELEKLDLGFEITANSTLEVMIEDACSID